MGVDRSGARTPLQEFSERSDASQVASRLTALRAELGRETLDGFIVPRSDAHRGEAVPASEARLAWLTGFTGSSGTAVIGLETAALLVDSRYTLQAPAQTDLQLIDVLQVPDQSVSDWIRQELRKGGRVGYDPWLMTPNEIDDLGKKLAGCAELVAVDNLVDRVWHDRPVPPLGVVEMLGDNRAGVPAADKIADLRKLLVGKPVDAALLTLPESICWLFNIRGRDVPNTPVVLGYALVPATGKPTLYLAPEKLDAQVRKNLSELAAIKSPDQLVADLEALGADGKRLLVDPASCPAVLATKFEAAGGKVEKSADPVLLPKSRKNSAELAGMREAHRLDGVAMAKFLKWFDGEAPGGSLDEINIVMALEAFRAEEPSLVDISFETISGAGPNGAIVHYRVTEKTNRALNPGEIMLVDSGAQYLSGTTDITRTLFTSSATAEQKDRFTRVLKGMIAVTRARFPKGTSGAQIDILARKFLWDDGVTYLHGTGHGVGAFLGVHEGPVGIAPRYSVPFEPGMVVSNEPGFYKGGEFGIRIENLITVVQCPDHEGFLEFETLTLAPIETRLIDLTLLQGDERDWLNAYHQRVFREIGPLVEPEVRDWLRNATQPI